MALKNNEVYVIGHKNPDTDSICSAIAYAYLKNKVTNSNRYVAKRAGDINDETAYVLEKFGVAAPEYVGDVSNRICDIEYLQTPSIDRNMSLREAWTLMHEAGSSTLAITRHGRLEGVITLDDVALSYMDAENKTLISEAHTKFRKMEETIGGHIVAGNPEAYYIKGKVLIAAADVDYMGDHIDEGDMVILGNKVELMNRAIDEGAGCLIVCTVDDIDDDTKVRAEKAGCTIICANMDTYSVARLLGQSMPVGYFMTRDNLVTFKLDEFTEDIKETMSKKHFKNFPVLDKKGHYLGMVSRRNLINEGKRQVILIDHNEKSQAVDGITNADVVEIIDHHKINTVETLAPIYFRNQPLGCSATIVARMYQEADVIVPTKMAGMLLSAILSDTLMFRSPTCTDEDRYQAEKLAQICDVNIEEHATAMFKAGSNFESKSIEEIIFQDYKKFKTGDYSYGVGQVNILTPEDGDALKARILEFYDKEGKHSSIDMAFIMLTNIIEEYTDLVFIGDDARVIVAQAFDTETDEHSAMLPGVLSRKKQLLPNLMTAINS